MLNSIQSSHITPIIGLLLFDSIAMSFITKYSKTSNIYDLLAAILFESIAWIFLVLGIKYRGLTVTNAIWDIGSLVLVTSIAIFYFREKLVLRHYVGLIFGIIAIVLLLRNEK